MKADSVVQKIQTTTSELTLLRQTLFEQNRTLKFQYNYEQIIGGRSESMLKLFYLLDKIIPLQNPVLIYGENGTGKELVAQTLHRQGEMVSVNCGSLNKELLESHLFGHVKGAFTGAFSDHEGLFVKAQGGTVFLDEIGEMHPDTQGKLLEVLETGIIRPLGSSVTFKVNYRLLAATHQNLEKMVKEKKFRKELFYRLNVIHITVPPLRERREDIPLLVDHFLDRLALQSNKPKKEITARALNALCFHHWPGNVRQLENTLEGIVGLVRKKIIDLEDLPKNIRFPGEKGQMLNLEEAKDSFTAKYLQQILDYTEGNVSEAARISGISRPTLHKLIHNFRGSLSREGPEEEAFS
jgi:DNA-binding NtrC family response regulator